MCQVGGGGGGDAGEGCSCRESLDAERAKIVSALHSGKRTVTCVCILLAVEMCSFLTRTRWLWCRSVSGRAIFGPQKIKRPWKWRRHGGAVVSTVSSWAFLCGVCMFSMCLSPSKNIHERQIGNSKMSVWSKWLFVSLCGPAMNSRLVPGAIADPRRRRLVLKMDGNIEYQPFWLIQGRRNWGEKAASKLEQVSGSPRLTLRCAITAQLF